MGEVRKSAVCLFSIMFRALSAATHLRRSAPLVLRPLARHYVFPAGQTELLNAPLSQTDPEIFDIIEKEKRRQRESIVLIPSENFTSTGVMQALGSVMQNKYSEGYPGARYYGGNEFIDQSERLCQQRALELFRLSPSDWGVNVQALSGKCRDSLIAFAHIAYANRISGKSLCVWCAVEATRAIDGFGSTAWWSPFARLPNRHEENLCCFRLLRDHALSLG
jgi:glycine hydroxymethyltransferase